MSANEPRWITLARTLIGTTEVKGKQHNPEILQMWRDIKRGGIKDDETPWCAAFVGAVLERCGIRSSRFESAASYSTWGCLINQPALGCIVVFLRDGGGHVGFVVGRDVAGNLLVLGGNQSDQVNVRAFSLDRVVAYRWPDGEPAPQQVDLPIASAVQSRSEA